MGGATLRNVMRMIAALENAPKIKKTFREIGGPCWTHKDYCKCEAEELCNLALAEFLGVNPGTALRSWRNLMFEMEELGIIETRLVENPRNRPRRLLKLTKDWREAFDEIYAKTTRELFEKWNY
ncbi:GntR family transcriptional regulator [Thermococcus barophilus]|uniref:HTH marR-type domain-containing protein n=1 Tax=Thermococcus barophilus (strain DSM 11836 / MP) TaxID=391623 RepID=F0LN63_THEBM|nr:hypothetical protein [Thermococcus barophilus]ADT85202.1 hypothetical protein TERMP_02229 [Thermococcus barophilus MP]